MTVTVMLCRFWSHNVQDGKSIVLPIKVSLRAVSEGIREKAIRKRNRRLYNVLEYGLLKGSDKA